MGVKAADLCSQTSFIHTSLVLDLQTVWVDVLGLTLSGDRLFMVLSMKTALEAWNSRIERNIRIKGALTSFSFFLAKFH